MTNPNPIECENPKRNKRIYSVQIDEQEIMILSLKFDQFKDEISIQKVKSVLSKHLEIAEHCIDLVWLYQSKLFKVIPLR